MAAASRCGIDTAGGVIRGGGQDFVTVEGALWAVEGDAIAPHPHGKTQRSAVMAQSLDFVKIDGRGACCAGHQASCGHVATGGGLVDAS